jgi:hypothetical protein
MQKITINGHVIERGQIWECEGGQIVIITDVLEDKITGIVHISDQGGELQPAKAGFYHWAIDGTDSLFSFTGSGWSLIRPLLCFECNFVRFGEVVPTGSQHPSIDKIEWLQEDRTDA